MTLLEDFRQKRAAPFLGWVLVSVLATTAPPARAGARSLAPIVPRGSQVVARKAQADDSELVKGVSEDRMVQRVRELCQLGPRMGGTESGKRAAEWIAKSFADAGLEVEQLEDAETWCHEEKSWNVVARKAGEEPRHLASAYPYGFSPSARGSAQVTSARNPGTAWLCSTSPRATAGAQAAAVALVDGATTLDGAYPVLHDLREADQTAFPVFGLSRADGELLRGWLAQGAEVFVDFEIEAKRRRARPTTVIARLAGSNSAPESVRRDYFLFCAHGDSDSGGPGANDNASGVAIVLEIAAAWSQAIKDGYPRPERDVRFAIWGKEIHSTSGFLSDHVPKDGELLGVINYDQAGFGSGSDTLYAEPDDLPANQALISSVLSVLRERSALPGMPERWATVRSLGGTDSYVFSGSDYCRNRGVPAVTLYSSAWGKAAKHKRTPTMPGESWTGADTVQVDYDLHYHSSGDTPENTTDREPWNMGYCARVGLLTAARFVRGRPAEPAAR